MGLKDAFKGMFNGEDEYEDDFNEEEYDDGYQESAPVEDKQPEEQYHAPERRSFSVGSVSDKVELKVVRPADFKSVQSIADHLLNSRTVVLNLEIANKEHSKRMIDFLSGVAYSIGGSLKKVAASTYVISPGSVEISQDNTAEPASVDEGAAADSFDGI